VRKGYVFKHFEEAFTRYLPPEGASEPLQRDNADETGTSDLFQSATPNPDVADRKCEKPNSDGHCSGVADGKGGSGEKTQARTARPKSGVPAMASADGERGLSSRRIQEHADWYSDQAYWHYSKNALAAGALDAELRSILRKEVSSERIELEFERVMKEVRGSR
jgi:hypothetical protein